MGLLRKPFDVRYILAQPAREASGGYTQCGYIITGYGPEREVNCRITGYVFSNGLILPLYTCDVVRDPIYTYKCEYIPYVPAQPATPARVEKTPRIGWDTAAQSTDGFMGDCELAFSIDPVTGGYIGLAPSSYGVTDPSRFACAFYLYQANYRANYTVVVGGKQCVAPAPYTAATVFKIRRVGGALAFVVDDQVVFTTNDPTDGDKLYAATTLYASGDAVPEIDSCCTAPPTGGS